jgi:hypothetical protein
MKLLEQDFVEVTGITEELTVSMLRSCYFARKCIGIDLVVV